jgi:STAM-binding protein
MDQDKYVYNMQSSSDFCVTDPDGRLKVLADYGNSVEIDNNIPPRRYYRSGLEMVRMANVYLDEGSLENAYILYMKFMTLFLEKIRQHPEFGSVSVSDRALNAQKLREVLPKAEKLKTRLLEQYTHEYKQYYEEQKLKEKWELERRKKEAQESKQHDSFKITPPLSSPEDKGNSMPGTSIVVMPPVTTDNVIYPEMLETEKLSYIPKPDGLSVSAPRTLPLPSVDRSTKPPSLLSPSIHSRIGLRNVIVPSRLMGKFMNLAQRNTNQNIETCGILAGTINHGELIITHLLIPKQNGTADSCTTQNEEEIFDYQDQHDLITLGWIHTHPSQTAFLSSVDLHTHCSYQLMMPEALAIVCAPRYQENGFFILTPNYGLDFIASCRATGFHPHPSEPPLYMKAEHSKLDNAAFIEVVDLRR